MIARIQKDGAAVKKYCDASSAEIQDAIRRYKKDLEKEEMVEVGAEHFNEEAKRELQRLAR